MRALVIAALSLAVAATASCQQAGDGPEGDRAAPPDAGQRAEAFSSLTCGDGTPDPGENCYNCPHDCFTAWVDLWEPSSIPLQIAGLDARQVRQVGNWGDPATSAAWAASNPGKLYIVGDEPDQYCVSPADYAVLYHDFVAAVRASDPTARFSPAGFAEPNGACCPEGDGACFAAKHYTSYAQAFYDAYQALYSVGPRVDEWRFHNFGLNFDYRETDAWYAQVSQAAAWSIDHGAPMVLGSFGFPFTPAEVDVRDYTLARMAKVSHDTRIVSAAWWSYHWPLPMPHELASGGALTADGQTYLSHHVCGNGTCDFRAESVASCPQDCGYCGDGYCNPTNGEVNDCPADCTFFLTRRASGVAPAEPTAFTSGRAYARARRSRAGSASGGYLDWVTRDARRLVRTSP